MHSTSIKLFGEIKGNCSRLFLSNSVCHNLTQTFRPGQEWKLKLSSLEIFSTEVYYSIYWGSSDKGRQWETLMVGWLIVGLFCSFEYFLRVSSEITLHSIFWLHVWLHVKTSCWPKMCIILGYEAILVTLYQLLLHVPQLSS